MKFLASRRLFLLCLMAPWLGAAQTPPVISFVPNPGVYPNATSRVMAVFIDDAETPPNQLTLAGASSNTNIVPNSGLVFGGSQNNRTLSIVPAANQTGAVSITLTVTDKSGLSASNSFAFDVNYFTPVATALPALGEGRAAWGDYDNDGRLDVLMCGYDGSSQVAYIYQNQSNGIFSNLNTNVASASRGNVSWVDYNHDGRLDLLHSGGYPLSWPKLYRNDGGNIFEPVDPGLPYIHDGGSFGAVAWGDFDNDGACDIALSGQSTNLTPSTFVARNNKDGTFSVLPAGLPGTHSGSLDWGDYDNDGDLDLAVSGSGTTSQPFTKVFQNTGKGTFAESVTNLTPTWLSSTYWGDYDNDGDLDLLVTGSVGSVDPQARIYRNDNGVFTDIAAGLTGVWFSQSAWADFDNDGRLDVILGGHDASGATVTKLYRNNGNQTFSEISAGLLNIQSGSYAWGDYDNDGDLDLLVMGFGCNFGCTQVQLYRNNAPTNAPPSTPGGLAVTQLPDNDVQLRWNAATDALTASSGLSYNLRVGTNSGGIEIISPQSDLANGFRRVPQSGYAHTNRWKLVDLAKGTYYWSVQAVDPSFAGSAFSTQGTFTITNSRPVINAPPALTTFPNVAVSNISFTIGDAETAATALVVTKSSANTNLLPDANILLGGTGSNRTVTLIPAGNRGGEAVGTLTVTDSGGLTKSTNFILKVEAFTSLASIGPVISTNASTISASCLAWVDYDNDGDLDVLFTHEYVNTYYYDETIILRNDSSGVFTPVDIGLTNIFAYRVAWGDVDNDGWPDLLVSGFRRDGNFSPLWTHLYHNTGGGQFELLPIELPQLDSGTVSIADINGDGYADLFVAGNLGGPYFIDVTKVFLGNGQGGFTEWKTDLPVQGIYNGASRWGDMDNDGDNDLLLGSSRLFQNDGNAHFTDVSNRLPPPPWGANSLDWADLDNDGDLDILIAGTTNVTCRNNSDGTFAYASSGITNIWYATRVALADYNNDGWVDVGLSPDGGSLFQNDGNHSFSLAATNIPPGIWGDADGDGDLDTVAGEKLYRNNCAVSNSPPSAPTALAATLQSGSDVLFSWSRSSDSQTTNAAGLCYNLRVGTTPSGVEVLSPLADTITGIRRIVGLGNAGQTNRWVLRDLPRGTYYWGVQAIDTAFAGSPFSTNATFTVTRPEISAIPDQQTAPGFPLAIPFAISDVETPASSLVLSATSANTNLVALTNIVFLGTDTNRTVTISPTAGAVGTNLITIAVADGEGFTDSTTFRLIVEPFLLTGNFSTGTSSRIYPADYNNDGLMDILVVGNPVQLWRNLGNGDFTNDATGLPALNYGSAAWGDFDNDGWLDLAFGDSTNVYRNSGTNVFAAVPTGMSYAPFSYNNVAWGDYDGDGRLDLVRMGYSYAQLFQNTGNGAFTNSGFTPKWGTLPTLGWADLNNDGNLDLVTGGDSGPFFTYIYRGNGGTNLSLVVSNTIIGMRSATVAFRDFDADGDLDVLLAGDAAGLVPTCRIYRNDGNFTFTNYIDLAAGTIRNAAWGDYNNDGLLDVLAYGSQATTVFVNLGNGTFTNIQANLPAVNVNGAAWADFDNDGDLDIVSTKLFINLRPLTNQPPQAPTGLTASFVSNTAVLSWNAPLDDTTSSNAFTYAVRLGTNPGGSQFLAPDADPATGFRRAVPEVATWQYRWRVAKNLPDGTYFWSVQAIDSGYAGSPFAAEASFSFFHPTISGPTNVAAYAAAPSVFVPLVVGDADSDPATLTLTAYFSNTNLLNATNILFGGANSNRTLTITLPPGTVGTSLVSVVVMDLTGLTATNTLRFESSYFSDVTPVFSGGNYYNAHWADFDNDDDLDVFYGGFIYRNDGSNGFALVASPGGANRNGVVWGDYDRDGDLDFAWTDGATLKIFRNDAGVFVNTGQNIALGGAAALAWGDFDNDGDLDLAVTQPSASRLYRNDGGVLTLTSASLPACSDGAVAWGDFDNDGDLDLLMAGLGYGPTDWRAEVFRNDGGGTFTAIGAGLFGTDHSSVAWGDVDNDGRLDALVTGFNYGSYVLKVYHNNGNGTFTDLNLPLQGVAYSDAGFGDFDNDGWLDIHLNGCKENYCATVLNAIYRNNHDGTFSDLSAGLPPTTAGQVGVGDYDNDGDLDLLADRLYRNNCMASNTPPTIPLSPTAQLLADNAVRLDWLAASDLETTNAAGLSYEIRVGTTPGGVNYVSPGADLASGYRRVPQRGAQNPNFCVLRDVPKGTYFWSAQAVDPTFAGSPFSVEGTFTITNARPIISAITNQITVPGRATAPIAFTVSDEETPAENLLVTAISTNTALVPNGNIVFGGSGSNRTVTVTPLAGLSGSTAIIISVMDAQGLIGTSRFDVAVQTFTEVNVGLPAVVASGASGWGDYDNDGDLDIAVDGIYLNLPTVYANSNGMFVAQSFNLAGTYPVADMVWQDFDRDGDLDLNAIAWDGYTKTNYFYRNNFITNSFTTLGIAGLTNIGDGIMAFGDYDSDGDLDLYLSGDPDTYHTPNAFGRLYRNDRGLFTNAGVTLPATVRGAAVWGDFDNDGDLDLIISGQLDSVATNSITRLMRNDGSLGFTAVATSLPGVTDCALAAGDFDNDGRLDLALAGQGTNAVAVTRVYRNLGNNVFTNLGTGFTGVTYATLAWGDYDGDGFLDLVASGSTNIVAYGNATSITKVYHNNGGASFSDFGGALPALFSHTASWGDYDNDGDLDLLLGSRLQRNNWNIPNTPPAAPTNLSFLLLSNNAVQFAWSPSSDLETTNPRGLSYNLSLGTNSGGVQIVSPMSAPGSGYRRVPQSGNLGQTNAWRIYNLANGTYYWSVQAVDTSFAGSPFAPEETFTLSRPVFSAITNRSVAPNTIVNIGYTVSDAETARSNLVLTVWSSDTNLVANENLLFATNGIVPVLTVTPNTNRSGTVTIMIVATDENNESGSVSFQITYERFADLGAGLSALVGQMAWGDYDNDGKLDLACGASVYHNTGSGVFTNLPVPFIAPNFQKYVAWGDFDNDNYLDLMAGNYIYRNHGAGDFTNLTPSLSATAIGIPVWGDYDNDGRPDLLYPYGNGIYLYRNNGNNTFSNINAGLPYIAQGSVAWCDYDKDGDLDILLTGNGLTRVYRNNGNGTFSDIAAGLPAMYNASVAWGDFDNDGWMDFVVAGATNNNVIGVATRLYRNTLLPTSGNRTFTNMPAFSVQGIWKGALAWGDYDADGDQDLLVSGEIMSGNAVPFTKIYRNDNGGFADSGNALPALKNTFAAWGDYDNDGALDLALSGNDAVNASISRIYRNYANGATNTMPNAPTSLTNVVFRKSVRLSWGVGSDTNQSAALTYNLRVGTSPGAGNIVNALSLSNGWRKLPTLGGALESQGWTFTNLTGGTFYWSVQAVDHSFAGSTFATERSFFVTNLPPMAVAKSATLNEDSSVGITFTGSDPDSDPLTYNVASQPLFGTLSGTPPSVTYTPRPDYFGLDLFTYRANDRTTDSAPAQVVIQVNPVADTTNFNLAIQSQVSGQMQLSMNSEPWHKYNLQASADLIHWVTLTNVTTTNQLWQVMDADAALYPQRFYRAGLLPFENGFDAGQFYDAQGFHFSLLGETGRVYQVHYSTDLINWTPLTTLKLTNSPLPLLDPGATQSPWRFYRILGP